MAGRWGSPEFKNRTSDLSYDGDDKLTQSLIKSPSMADARSTIAAEYAWSGKKKGRADYSTIKNRDKDDLNYLQMAGVYASDLGGLIVGKEDRKAQGVLGSYALSYEITKTKGDTLTVQCHAGPTSTMSRSCRATRSGKRCSTRHRSTRVATSPASASTSSGRNPSTNRLA